MLLLLAATSLILWFGNAEVAQVLGGTVGNAASSQGATGEFCQRRSCVLLAGFTLKMLKFF
jgi:hypothetical protein